MPSDENNWWSIFFKRSELIPKSSALTILIGTVGYFILGVVTGRQYFEISVIVRRSVANVYGSYDEFSISRFYDESKFDVSNTRTT